MVELCSGFNRDSLILLHYHLFSRFSLNHWFFGIFVSVFSTYVALSSLFLYFSGFSVLSLYYLTVFLCIFCSLFYSLSSCKVFISPSLFSLNHPSSSLSSLTSHVFIISLYLFVSPSVFSLSGISHSVSPISPNFSFFLLFSSSTSLCNSSVLRPSFLHFSPYLLLVSYLSVDSTFMHLCLSCLSL